MAYTSDDLKAQLIDYVNTNPGWNWLQWNDETYWLGLHHKFDYQLEDLQAAYPKKLKQLYEGTYEPTYAMLQEVVSSGFVVVSDEDDIAGLKAVKDKAWRIATKWRAVNAELYGREQGVFGPGLTYDRTYVGTTYYLDLDGGSDASPHTGLKYGDYTMEAGSGATTLVETGGLDARVTNGDWTPSYVYNVTRSAGALVTNSVYAGGTWTLTHATISGQTDGDTYYILDSWLTLAQYTTTTARSTGDIGYVRANTSETLAVVLECDEDGDKDTRISIVGCDSVTNDPWGDASDVKPAADFNASVNYFYFSDAEYWRFERMVFRNSTYSYGNVTVDKNTDLYIKDCEFLDSTVHGIKMNGRGFAYAEGCLFSNNDSAQVFIQSGTMRLRSCVLDAGAGGGNRGVDMYYGGFIELVDCSLGQTNAFTNADLHLSYTAKVFMRNCQHNNDFNVTRTSVIYEEDVDGVKGANRMICGVGTVTKDTGVVRSGGAESSAKMEPASVNGLNNFLSLRNSIIEFPFKIKRPAVLTTLTVYIRSLGTWSTYPTADELYLEASYLDEAATSASRAKVQSNDVLSHPSDWKAFDVTFTPLQEGIVYLNVSLKKYENVGDGCYVSMEPPEIT